MKEIQLTRGFVALIDDDDFGYVSQFSWFAEKIRNVWYACRRQMIDDVNKKFYMHRMIMRDSVEGQEIDHKNGDGLDNQKNNLRIASRSDNQANRKNLLRHVPKTSVYRGVLFNKKTGKWEAKIKKCGKRIFIGCYYSELEAARAYDEIALMIFKEFASPNFPADDKT